MNAFAVFGTMILTSTGFSQEGDGHLASLRLAPLQS
jgi:hypothetical protein